MCAMESERGEAEILELLNCLSFLIGKIAYHLAAVKLEFFPIIFL